MGKPVVLVVEDEPLVRFMLADFLIDGGFEVIEAHDAASALVVFESGAHIDLLLTDARMPGEMDGLGLVEWARRHRPGLRIIVASGHVSEGEAPLADAVLPKPYRLGEVEARLRELLPPAGARVGERAPVA